MDKLAKKGVNFTNAHCSSPGCSPSRNALLYGVEPFKSGLYAFYEEGPVEETIKTYTSLPLFFRQNGYETFGSGKIFHGQIHAPADWTDYRDPIKKKTSLDLAAGYQRGDNPQQIYCPMTNPMEDHVDHQFASYGVEILKQRHDKPFFLAVGLTKPHIPCVCPKQFFDLYPEVVEAPPINPNDLDDLPAVGANMATINNDAIIKKDNAWNTIRRAYLACISWTDYNVGRVLDELAASPYADNTVVVLWSDHGFTLGEKGHFSKFTLWEESTRVPFLIWDARDKNAPTGRKVVDAVSLINIYRTLAELSGEQAPDYVEGFSLVPQLKDPSTPIAQPAICTWGRGNYTVRDRDWRYIRYYDGSEELYSHAKDPNEWTNLANNPEYEQVKKRLAASLPTKDAPLVAGGAEWSIVGADKPLKQAKKTKAKGGE